MNATTTIQLALPLTTYQALQHAAQTAHKSETEFILAAVENFLEHPPTPTSLLGLFAHEPGLMEQVVEEVMLRREHTPLRVREAVNG